MTNTEAVLAVAFLIICMVGGFAYAGSRDARRMREAAAILAQPGSAALGLSLPAQGLCFRKRRIMCLFYVLLFLALGPGMYLDTGKPGRNQPPRDLSGQIADACIAVVPLLLAVRQWKYRVIVFEREMRIHAIPFGTQTIRFDQVDALKIETTKYLSNCMIQLNDGKRIAVGSDLIDFLKFSALLSRQVRAARATRPA